MEDDKDNNIDPELLAKIDAIVRAMSGAFDEMFCRPDAREIVDGFLDGRTTFIVTKGGVTFTVDPPEIPDTVPTWVK